VGLPERAAKLRECWERLGDLERLLVGPCFCGQVWKGCSGWLRAEHVPVYPDVPTLPLRAVAILYPLNPQQTIDNRQNA